MPRAKSKVVRKILGGGSPAPAKINIWFDSLGTHFQVITVPESRMTHLKPRVSGYHQAKLFSPLGHIMSGKGKTPHAAVNDLVSQLIEQPFSTGDAALGRVIKKKLEEHRG